MVSHIDSARVCIFSNYQPVKLRACIVHLFTYSSCRLRLERFLAANRPLWISRYPVQSSDHLKKTVILGHKCELDLPTEFLGIWH